MENNKQEILSRLFAIRAGLSAISSEANELRRSEINTQHISCEMKVCNESYKERIIQTKVQTNSKKYLKETSVVKMVIESILISLAAVVIAIIPFFVIAVIIDLVAGISSGKDVMEYEYIIIADIMVFIITFFISFFLRYKENNRIKQFNKKSYENGLNEQNCLRNKFEGEYEKYNSEYKKANNIYEDTKKEVKTTVQILFNYMMEEFNDFLDYRDWQNVDLIIFYIETRRAETLKEALYQVDRRNQDYDINRACGNVAMIWLSSPSMLDIVGNYFSRLESKMYEKINDLLGEESDNLKKYVALHIKSIISKEGLQDAFKSNEFVNSNKLVSNMKYVLNYGSKN